MQPTPIEIIAKSLQELTEKDQQSLSSINVTKNSKGYNFNVKRYYNSEKESWDAIITEIEQTYLKLNERFKGDTNE